MPIAAALALLLGQPGIQAFAGTWTVELGGVTFARLELRQAGAALDGRISLGSMHLNAQGEIDRVDDPAVNFTPLFDVVYRDGVLSFARKDQDDTDRFVMRVDDQNSQTAQFSFVVTDKFAKVLKEEGIAVPKPITLRRRDR